MRSQLVAAHQHTCVIEDSGNMRCFGGNHLGRAPALVEGNYTQVAGGEFFTCAIDEAGKMTCWGLGFDDGHTMDTQYLQVRHGL